MLKRVNGRMVQRLAKAILVAALAAWVTVFYLGAHEPAASAPTAYYQRQYAVDTGASNIVAAIYLNYRMFDSMLETLMLLVSVTAVGALSWRKEHE